MFTVRRLRANRRFSRTLPFSLALVLASTALARDPLLGSAAAGATPDPTSALFGSADELVAREVAKLTGVALTPLLGLGFIGLDRWMHTPEAERQALPFHQQPWFFGSALALALVLFLGHRVPVIRTAFKMLKAVESPVSGLLALPIVAQGVAVALRSGTHMGATSPLWPPEPAIVAAGVLGAVVWLVGHTVNVLVLLSPAPPIDWLLKGSKAALVGFLLAASTISPWLALVVSLAYVLVALALAGWAWRLLRFGTVLALDLLLRRSLSLPPGAAVPAFAAGVAGVPQRSSVRVRAEGGLLLLERPLRRAVTLGATTEFCLARDFIGLQLLRSEPSSAVVLRFAPRFSSRLAELAERIGVPAAEASLGTGTRAARWLRDHLFPHRVPS